MLGYSLGGFIENKEIFRTEREPSEAIPKIGVFGPSITERFGGQDTRGQVLSTICASDESAFHRAASKMEERLKQGYAELEPPPWPGSWYSAADAATEERFLNCLDLAEKGLAPNLRFNSPASADSIAALETEYQITLPKSLRSFLLYCDGGTILARVEYNQLFSIRQIREEYAHQSFYRARGSFLSACQTMAKS